MTKVFTIASGKGGTGKTMTTANLGTALALLGKRTIILDADIGMANLGLVLGLEKSKITLHEVLAGKADIQQAIYELPTGLRVVPSGISLQGFQNADPDRLQFVMSKLVMDADYVLIDAPAGISKDGVIPLAIADEVLLVVNPELSSLADSVKIKVLTEMVGGAVGGVVLNRASAEKTMLTSQKIGQIMGAEVLEVPRAPLPRVEDLHIPARDGWPLPARLYAPSTRAQAPALPLLLYLHGGGFTIGSIATHDILCRELARSTPCMVVSLDYRLAPEHPFPTATHDAWDALAWLAQHAPALGADPARLAVGGDSAGGTLAAVNAILARDAGLPLALQLLIYPGCTAHQDTPSHRRYAQGLVLEAPAIEWFFGHYVRNPAERTDWRFAPLLAPDVEGVAPAWIGLAECDPLVDEGLGAYFGRKHASRCDQGRMDARRSAPSMLHAWTSAATPQTPPLIATRRAMALRAPGGVAGGSWSTAPRRPLRLARHRARPWREACFLPK